MKTPSLTQKKCLPCEGIADPLSAERVTELLSQIEGWNLREKKIAKTFRFKNFVALMEFIVRMAELAEAEGHHPDFHVKYNILDVEIWTHALDDLSENDFILAAKIDGLKG